MNWSEQDYQEITSRKDRGETWQTIAASYGVTKDTIRHKYTKHQQEQGARPQSLALSSYPVYNDPLTMEGDALVLPDPEFPFHDADFINRCFDLAAKWGIRQCMIAGDALHLDSLSGWDKSWQQSKSRSHLDEQDELDLREMAQSLPADLRSKMLDKIVQIGGSGGDGLSDELAQARRCMQTLASNFDRVDYILGNHEGRFLAALKTPMFPEELLRLLELEKKWRISPYYFGIIVSDGRGFQVEHPKGAAESTAQRLADKYECHILMAHSHALSWTWSTSGKWQAIQMGHCVDEARLPYASQRHNTRRQHLLGAVIVRDGYPWLLHAKVDWGKLTKLA